MRSKFTKFQETYANLKLVFAFTYKLDKYLVIKYFGTAILGAIAPIGLSYALKLLIDNLTTWNTTGQTQQTFVIILAAIIGYYLLNAITDVLYWGLNNSYYDYLLRNKLQNELSYRYSEKISSLDIQHLEDAEIQNQMTKVENTYAWQIPDAMRYAGYLMRHAAGLIASTLVLLPLAPWIPALILLLAIPRAYFKAKHGNAVWSMYGGNAPQSKKLYYLGDLLTSRESITEARIFNSTPTLLHKYKEIQTYLYNVAKKPLEKYRLIIFVFAVIEFGVTAIILYFLVPQALLGTLTVGTFIFILTTTEQLKGHVVWGSSQIGELYEKTLYIKPYFDILALPKIIKEKKNARSFKSIKPPQIEFKNVSFSYPNGRKVLNNISFTIQPGENVALVGINGAGKSTVIKLLCRFYDVTSGEILINGINIKDLNLANWYQHLGTLFQDFVKYNFTIKENIMLGAPKTKDDKRMIHAAKQSGVTEFIQKMDKKYDQMLGRRFEDGEELSGGQWQKLAIARAFYQQAPILIMDEPTSAIDAESEEEIFNNLEKIYKDKTLILVSHRFSTVRNAQKIVVIDSGEIIEQGSHHELLKNNSKYASMFNAQAKGYQG